MTSSPMMNRTFPGWLISARCVVLKYNKKPQDMNSLLCNITEGPHKSYSVPSFIATEMLLVLMITNGVFSQN